MEPVLACILALYVMAETIPAQRSLVCLQMYVVSNSQCNNVLEVNQTLVQSDVWERKPMHLKPKPIKRTAKTRLAYLHEEAHGHAAYSIILQRDHLLVCTSKHAHRAWKQLSRACSGHAWRLVSRFA